MVVAAVHLEVGCKRDTTNEEENGIECIRCQHEEWRDGKSLIDRSRDEVEERQHSEDGNKHDIVDNRGVVASCIGDHVSNKCHYEEGPEELLRSVLASAWIIV